MTLLYPHWIGLSIEETKRAAAWVFADQAALDSFELGETTYPNNVVAELDRAIDARNRKSKSKD